MRRHPLLWLALLMISRATGLADPTIALRIPAIQQLLGLDDRTMTQTQGVFPLGLAAGGFLAAYLGRPAKPGDHRKPIEPELLLPIAATVNFGSLIALSLVTSITNGPVAFMLLLALMGAGLGGMEAAHASLSTAHYGDKGLMRLNRQRLLFATIAAIVAAPLLTIVPPGPHLATIGVLALLLALGASTRLAIPPSQATALPNPTELPMRRATLARLLGLSAAAVVIYGTSFNLTTSNLPDDLALWQGAVAVAVLSGASIAGYSAAVKLGPQLTATFALPGAIVAVSLLAYAAFVPAHALVATIVANTVLGSCCQPLLVLVAKAIGHNPVTGLNRLTVNGICTFAMYGALAATLVTIGQLTTATLPRQTASVALCVAALVPLAIGAMYFIRPNRPRVATAT